MIDTLGFSVYTKSELIEPKVWIHKPKKKYKLEKKQNVGTNLKDGQSGGSYWVWFGLKHMGMSVP